jgi:hypothetical protein
MLTIITRQVRGARHSKTSFLLNGDVLQNFPELESKATLQNLLLFIKQIFVQNVRDCEGLYLKKIPPKNYSMREKFYGFY